MSSERNIPCSDDHHAAIRTPQYEVAITVYLLGNAILYFIAAAH
jgi:hypothetical protein